MNKNEYVVAFIIPLVYILLLLGCYVIDDIVSNNNENVVCAESDLDTIDTTFKRIVIDDSFTADRNKYILIDEETGIQYIYVCGTHGSVAITPRLNSNGDVMIYKEVGENEKTDN